MDFKTGRHGGKTNRYQVRFIRNYLILNKIISNSVSDWNAKIIPDDFCDDTLENDQAVTEVMDFWKYSAFNLHSWQVNILWDWGVAAIRYFFN